jgi:hypothetical protein
MWAFRSLVVQVLESETMPLLGNITYVQQALHSGKKLYGDPEITDDN